MIVAFISPARSTTIHLKSLGNGPNFLPPSIKAKALSSFRDYSTNSISPGLHVLSNQGSKGP